MNYLLILNLTEEKKTRKKSKKNHYWCVANFHQSTKNKTTIKPYWIQIQIIIKNTKKL